VNRSELRGRLQNHFNNTVYYTQEDLDDSIQDGIDEVCAFSGCIFKSAQLPITNGTTYYDLLTLLPDYIGVVAIFNKAINRWLIPSSIRKFEQDRPDWDSIYGTPTQFCPINHRYVALYRKPSSDDYGNMVVLYRAAAPILSDELTIPIPDDHDALENYVITDLWEQAQEWDKSSTALKTYIESLDALRVLIQNKRNSDRLMSLK
jgi:hypothetical protein